jgi:hypothetical protein
MSKDPIGEGYKAWMVDTLRKMREAKANEDEARLKSLYLKLKGHQATVHPTPTVSVTHHTVSTDHRGPTGPYPQPPTAAHRIPHIRYPICW